MLVQFTVDNFRSIKDPVTFSLVSGSSDGTNSVGIGKYRLLKSAVIYGANASGKSNVLKALAFMRSLVLNDTKVVQSTDRLPHEPFRLSTETEGASSSFEIVFFADQVKYRYGFEADSTDVYAEWLFADERGREARLFFRDRSEDELYVNPERFREGKGVKVLNNSLFLWKCDQNGGTIARRILSWFKNMNLIFGMSPSQYLRYTVKQMEQAGFREEIVNLVSAADLGIRNVVLQREQISSDEVSGLKLPDAVKKRILEDDSPLVLVGVKAVHEKYNEKNQIVEDAQFDFGNDESEGTKKYFSLSAPILDTLKNGRILLIDELDASLHPLLVANLVTLFNDPSVNKKSAQLIFATHDTNLLNQALFHKSQIWFTEKDVYGATHLTSLVEYRNVRREDNVEKHYIQGKYGAIPILGDFTRALSQ